MCEFFKEYVCMKFLRGVYVQIFNGYACAKNLRGMCPKNLKDMYVRVF